MSADDRSKRVRSEACASSPQEARIPRRGSECTHAERRDGICTTCGHCLHELILNGACFYCGTTDLDPIALSPKPPKPLIPADRLARKK